MLIGWIRRGAIITNDESTMPPFTTDVSSVYDDLKKVSQASSDRSLEVVTSKGHEIILRTSGSGAREGLL